MFTQNRSSAHGWKMFRLVGFGLLSLTMAAFGLNPAHGADGNQPPVIEDRVINAYSYEFVVIPVVASDPDDPPENLRWGVNPVEMPGKVFYPSREVGGLPGEIHYRSSHDQPATETLEVWVTDGQHTSTATYTLQLTQPTAPSGEWPSVMTEKPLFTDATYTNQRVLMSIPYVEGVDYVVAERNVPGMRYFPPGTYRFAAGAHLWVYAWSQYGYRAIGTSEWEHEGMQPSMDEGVVARRLKGMKASWKNLNWGDVVVTYGTFPNYNDGKCRLAPGETCVQKMKRRHVIWVAYPPGDPYASLDEGEIRLLRPKPRGFITSGKGKAIFRLNNRTVDTMTRFFLRAGARHRTVRVPAGQRKRVVFKNLRFGAPLVMRANGRVVDRYRVQG